MTSRETRNEIARIIASCFGPGTCDRQMMTDEDRAEEAADEILRKWTVVEKDTENGDG